MLIEPTPTPWDLRWRMLGTDVRIHPFFWIFTALLGWDWFNSDGLPLLFLWIVAVFVSILVHEFGHVLMGRWFGSRDQYIVLYSFGGLAVGIFVPKRYQRILVSFAGPVAQFLLLGVVLLTWFLLARAGLVQRRTPLAHLLFMLVEINLFWPVLNLLPIWPLDGGQITREVFQIFWKRDGVAYSLLLSAIVSGLLALHCLLAENGTLLFPFLWMVGGVFMGIFFALFAIQSFQAWQFENDRNRRGPNDRLPWE